MEYYILTSYKRALRHRITNVVFIFSGKWWVVGGGGGRLPIWAAVLQEDIPARGCPPIAWLVRKRKRKPSSHLNSNACILFALLGASSGRGSATRNWTRAGGCPIFRPGRPIFRPGRPISNPICVSIFPAVFRFFQILIKTIIRRPEKLDKKIGQQNWTVPWIQKLEDRFLPISGKLEIPIFLARPRGLPSAWLTGLGRPRS